MRPRLYKSYIRVKVPTTCHEQLKAVGAYSKRDQNQVVEWLVCREYDYLVRTGKIKQTIETEPAVYE